jgi:hypothetical protein
LVSVRRPFFDFPAAMRLFDLSDGSKRLIVGIMNALRGGAAVEE